MQHPTTPPASPQDPASYAEPEALQFDSDFTPFLGERASDDEHRAGLRRLWLTSWLFGHFDGLDVYRGDYRERGRRRRR